MKWTWTLAWKFNEWHARWHKPPIRMWCPMCLSLMKGRVEIETQWHDATHESVEESKT